MKNIAKKSIHAIYPKIDTSKTNFSLELFGLDFLIDSNFRPWLLEINTNPCLELSSPIL
jgi:D-alanine-D-alanine ligase-like ATP-grasp enzyme